MSTSTNRANSIFSVKNLCIAGMIAALYVVLTYLSNLFGLAIGLIQFRLSEALCILPLFTPAAIPGLFIGCILGNLLSGSVVWDILFGSLATLIAAILTYLCRKLPAIPRLVGGFFAPILMNTLIIPPILVYCYDVEEGYLIALLAILIGETLSVTIAGGALYAGLARLPKKLWE